MLARSLFGLRRVGRNAEAVGFLQSRFLSSSSSSSTSSQPEASATSANLNADAIASKPKAGLKKSESGTSADAPSVSVAKDFPVPKGKNSATSKSDDKYPERSAEQQRAGANASSATSRKSSPAARKSGPGMNNITKSSGGGAGSGAGAGASNSSSQWCEIEGFSRYASRFDVESALQHPSVQVLSLYPELSPVLYPTGRWYVQMEMKKNSSGGSGSSSSSSGSKGASAAAAAVTSSTQPVEICRVHFMERFSRRITIRRTAYSPRLALARSEGITPSTLRMLVSTHASLDHLKYFFEDYALAVDRKSLRRILEPPNSSQGTMYSWLVHFRTPAEAQRAYQCLDRKYLLGQPVDLFRYT
jgi:hypothetical protein